MFVSSKKVSQERYATCQSCKYYVKSTDTCGPLGVGKRVQVDGQKYKLCGCIMRVKTKLVVSACPIGKWHRQITEAQYNAAKAWVAKHGAKHQLSREAAIELVELSNAVLGKNNKMSGCGSCLRSMAQEMKRAIDVGL